MYMTILVPVDGSATANAGLAEAIRLGRLTGATLRLLHVADLRPYASGYDASIGYTGDLIERVRESGLAVLKEAEAQVRAAGLAVQTQLIETFSARASDLIVDQANTCGAELVVIGTHGRRGIQRLMLGSDAEQVLRQSPVPVLLVRGRPETTPVQA